MQRMDFYQRAPAFLQTLLCNLEALKINRTRYGPGFDRIFRDVSARANWPESKVIAFRDERIRTFIASASKIPFYETRFAEAAVDPAGVRSLEDLARLPVLTKSEARENIRRLQNPHCADKPFQVRTGGTTGAGLHFLTTVPALNEQWALWWRYRAWHGIGRDTWCGYFGARAVCAPSQQDPPFWRVNYLHRQILFSGYHMTDRNLASYVGEIRRRRPPWLHGFPTLLATFASYVADRNLDLGYQIQCVTIGAESLMENQIAVMQKAFGVRPRQHYGMAEGVANFSECEQGRLHVDEDYAAVELLPAEDEGVFRVLGTNLSNRMTPMIRYEVGDVVTAGEKCSCGRPGRVIGAILGRTADYVKLNDGRMFGPANVLFSKMTNVRAGQIAQLPSGALRFQIIRAPGFTADDEANLRSEIGRRIGNDVVVGIEYVAALTKTPAGKTPIVIHL